MPRTTFVGVLSCLMLSAAPAYADGFVTPFLGYNFGGDSVNCLSLTSCQDKQVNAGISFRSAGKVAAWEQDISFVRRFFGPGNDHSVLTVMTNLSLTLPIGPIQPYVIGGIGLVRPDASYNPLQLVTSKSALGTDLGAGMTLMFGRRVGVRGDVRRFHALQDLTLGVFSGESLDFWRASVGLTFSRGGSTRANPYAPPTRR